MAMPRLYEHSERVREIVLFIFRQLFLIAERDPLGADFAAVAARKAIALVGVAPDQVAVGRDDLVSRHDPDGMSVRSEFERLASHVDRLLRRGALNGSSPRATSRRPSSE